jgi:hypothetical protein
MKFDEKNIEIAIEPLHLVHRLVAQIVDEIVDESLCCDALDASFL